MGNTATTGTALQWALKGIQAERKRAEGYVTELRQQEQAISQQLQGSLSNGTSGTTRGPGRPKKAAAASGSQSAAPRRTRKISAETRKRMSEAQRRRHASKAGQDVTQTAPAIPQPPTDFQLPETVQ